jgi:hypothetical protein
MAFQLRKQGPKQVFSLGTVRKMVLRKSAEDAEDIRKAEDAALVNQVLDQIEKEFICIPRDSPEGKRLCQM